MGAAEEQEVEQEEVPDVVPEDQSDSDVGGIGGFNKKEEEEKPKRRRITKPSPPDDTGGNQSSPPESQAANAAPANAKRRNAKNTDAELASLVKNAESSLSSVQSISPLQVYQNSIRGKEVDKRLSAATTTLAALEHVLTSDQAQRVSETLTRVCTSCTEFLDVLAPLMGNDDGAVLAHVRSMDAKDIKQFASVLPPDCSSAVLVDVGKRLLEARVATGVTCNEHGCPKPSQN